MALPAGLYTVYRVRFGFSSITLTLVFATYAIAPDDRGEVTAAFVICVYTGVAVAAISVGLLSEVVTPATAVGVASAAIGLVAVATAAAHGPAGRSRAEADGRTR